MYHVYITHLTMHEIDASFGLANAFNIQPYLAGDQQFAVVE